MSERERGSKIMSNLRKEEEQQEQEHYCNITDGEELEISNSRCTYLTRLLIVFYLPYFTHLPVPKQSLAPSIDLPKEKRIEQGGRNRRSRTIAAL